MDGEYLADEWRPGDAVEKMREAQARSPPGEPAHYAAMRIAHGYGQMAILNPAVYGPQ
jgi:hypothetical protein